MDYTNLKQRLLHGEQIILDGPIGTECERRGIPMDPKSWCGSLTVDYGEELKNIHRDYILAGADIITANTYASSRFSLEYAGVGHLFEKLNKSAVEIAKSAAEEVAKDQVIIAGSISHKIPVISGTALPDLSQEPETEKMTQMLTEHAIFLRECGCNLLLLEMMYDPRRMESAFIAAKNSGLPAWAGFSAREAADGRILSFTPDREIDFHEIVKILKKYEIEGAGVMHTPSNLISGAINIIKTEFKGPLMAYPDSGYFKMPNWQFEDIISPESFCTFAHQWAQEGIQIIGGCCGLSPQHIATLKHMRESNIQ